MAKLASRRLAIGLLISCVGLASATGGEARDAVHPVGVPDAAAPRRELLDADGLPIILSSYEQIRRFLERARVLYETELDLATRSRPSKLLLARDGVRAHAIFHQVERSAGRVQLGERVIRGFRDSYRKLWLVDHTRAFTTQREPARLETIERCSSDLWSRLRQLEAREIRRTLGPYLDPRAIEATVDRQRLLRRRIRRRIERLGEAAVLFDLDGAVGSW